MTGETQSKVSSGRRTVVLVIGMHRSGTSTVAGALGILGATMPATGLGLSDDNPKGHFEPREIVALHDRVLASSGMHWWDWDIFPESWYETAAAAAFTDELAGIVRAEFGDAPLFVVKDPRTCKLIPLWRRAAAILGLDMVAVLPFRHPDEVARSLQARDGFPLPNSHLMWLRYVLEAERESRDMPRVFVRYEDLLTDGRTQMTRIENSLGLHFPRKSERALRELDAFIDPGLRRSKAVENGLDHLHPWLRDAVSSYADGTAHGPDGTVLDRLHAEFGTACAAFVPALHATNKGFEDAQRRNMLIPGLETALQDALKDGQDAARERELRAAAEAKARTFEIEAAQVAGLKDEVRRRDERVGRLEALLEIAEQKAAPRGWLRRRSTD